MKKFMLILILIVLSMCACGNSPETDQTQENIDNIEEIMPVEPRPPETTSERGEETMSEPLITKEELLEYVAENQHLETVDVTVEDFDGIDIDGFIEYWYLTKENIKNRFLKIAIEGYIEDMELGEWEIYFAESRVSVDSTDEEFQEFIQRFLLAIGKETIHSGKSGEIVSIDINDEERTRLYIAQTKNIYELNIGNDPHYYPNLLTLFVEDGPDGAGTRGNICYNKTQKYLMLADTNDPLFEYVKVFCGLEG